MSVQVRIWGCRGSVATPGPETVTYGGNTACVEVRAGDDVAIVLDAGTGIRALGGELVQRGTRRIHLFLTHLHLDHVEGLRFFAPLFNPAVELEIWGPRSPTVGLRERILRAFSPPLFPIDLRDVPARVSYHDLPAEPLELDGVRISSDLVLHPGPTLGYRVDTRTSSLVYLPDHEPALAGIAGRPLDWVSAGALARGADVVVHDAQYSEEEYGAKIGWGHSSVADAVAFAHAVAAGRLVLFHHEPTRSDRNLELLEQRACDLDDSLSPLLAREGMMLEL